MPKRIPWKEVVLAAAETDAERILRRQSISLFGVDVVEDAPRALTRG
jgi:hypothetical protein